MGFFLQVAFYKKVISTLFWRKRTKSQRHREIFYAVVHSWQVRNSHGPGCSQKLSTQWVSLLGGRNLLPCQGTSGRNWTESWGTPTWDRDHRFALLAFSSQHLPLVSTDALIQLSELTDLMDSLVDDELLRFLTMVLFFIKIYFIF